MGMMALLLEHFMEPTRGRCLCGQTQFEFIGSPNWCGHCHCETCRRNTSSPFTTWLGVPKQFCRLIGKPPRAFSSSEGVRRLFCEECGTPMAFESEKWPDEIHLYAASLEDSANVVPQFHVHFAEKVPWIEISDALPRYQHRAS